MIQNIRVETLIQQGYDQLERGQSQVAIISLLDALQRHEEAISSCHQALKIKIDFPEAGIAWNIRGITLAQLQRHEEALASYEKALEIKPDFQEAWCNRGKAL